MTAAESIAEQYADVMNNLIGDCTRLEDRVAERGIPTRFVGRRSRPEALLDLCCADLLVHPSTQEGAPTVIREARALGVPVVCCACGDVETWAEGDDGLLVVTDDDLGPAVVAQLEKRSTNRAPLDVLSR